MRHPSERGRQRELKTVVFLAVRNALYAPAHPDSKRQARRKARDLTRYGARVLKESHVTSCPLQRTNKRREIREMRERIETERNDQARKVAARLLGKPLVPKPITLATYKTKV